jgi:hypothetical protein
MTIETKTNTELFEKVRDLNNKQATEYTGMNLCVFFSLFFFFPVPLNLNLHTQAGSYGVTLPVFIRLLYVAHHFLQCQQQLQKKIEQPPRDV